MGDEYRRRVEGGHRHRIRDDGHGVREPLTAARTADATARGVYTHGHRGCGHAAHVHLMLLLHLHYLHLMHVRGSIRHWHRRVRMGVRMRVVVRRWGTSVEGGA
jgi:hypothetical protein